MLQLLSKGCSEALLLFVCEGDPDGSNVGLSEGETDGPSVGVVLGKTEGVLLEISSGDELGNLDCDRLGIALGAPDLGIVGTSD